MSWAALLRVVEAFFRRWPFYVLLLVGALAIGVYTVSEQTDEYTSTGQVFVDAESLVTAQSGVRDGGFFSFLTPAQFTAQELGGLISTQSFMEAVLVRAGIELDAAGGPRNSQVDAIRRSVSTYANSENLVAVSVTTFDPNLSHRLVNGIIDEFVQFQITIDVAESGASEEFFTALVESYREDLVEAQREVDAMLRGVADLEELDPDESLELERLQAAEALTEERFQAAAQNVEASRLATLQAETDIRQSYSVFDPPDIPTEPNGSLLDDLTVLTVFGMAGLVLALIGPVASAIMNRTVQFAADLEHAADVSVVAVLPSIAAKQLDPQGALASTGFGGTAPFGEAIGSQTITFLPAADTSPDPDSRPIDHPTAPLPVASGVQTVKPVEPPGPKPATATAQVAVETEPEVSDQPKADGEPETGEPEAGDGPQATADLDPPPQIDRPQPPTKPAVHNIGPPPALPDPVGPEHEQGFQVAVRKEGETVPSPDSGGRADDETPAPDDLPGPLQDLLATADLGDQFPTTPPMPPRADAPKAPGDETRQSRV